MEEPPHSGGNNELNKEPTEWKKILCWLYIRQSIHIETIPELRKLKSSKEEGQMANEHEKETIQPHQSSDKCKTTLKFHLPQRDDSHEEKK